MTLDALLIALCTGLCGLTVILGVYELVTGRIPGNPVRRGVWGYHWINTPIRLRLASLAGLLALVAFLILFKPFSLGDLLLGAIGVFLGIGVVVSDSHSPR